MILTENKRFTSRYYLSKIWHRGQSSFPGVMFCEACVFYFLKAYQCPVALPAFSHFTHDQHLSIYVK